jgi:hypothetical protein
VSDVPFRLAAGSGVPQSYVFGAHCTVDPTAEERTNTKIASDQARFIG